MAHHYDPAQALVEEIRAKGSRALALRADVSDEAQVQAMFGAMLKNRANDVWEPGES